LRLIAVYILLIISTAFIAFKNSDQLPLENVYSRYKSDPVSTSKLQLFEEKGYEKDVDNKSISPGEIISEAKKYMGVKHCMGGASINCLDCSGLLVVVFREYNIVLPHNSEEQARYGKIISDYNDLREGDLVFFIKTYETERLITHSGIFLGNNKFIHTSSKKGVVISEIMDDPYWGQRFIFGTRLFWH
jgi:cell wall-associated NlpC family hydrolase